MTALSAERARETENWVYHEFTLTGVKAWKGGEIFLLVAGANKGKVTNVPGANAVYLGTCWRTVDATASDAKVTVRLPNELQNLAYFVNGDSIASTDVGKSAFSSDDQTVTKGVNGTRVGTIIAVDPVRGVLVKRENLSSGTGVFSVPAAVSALPAFVANDSAPTVIVHGATYTVPATAAASTISLPSAANYPDGVLATIVADGVNNSFSIQVRDVTTNITAALTAAKRIVIYIETVGGKWYACPAVAP